MSNLEIKDMTLEGRTLKIGYDDKGQITLAVTHNDDPRIFLVKPEDAVALLEVLEGATAKVEQLKYWKHADAEGICRCYSCDRAVESPGFCKNCIALNCEQQQLSNTLLR